MMDKRVEITDNEKSRMAVICFIPAIGSIICIAYYLFLLLPLIHGHHPPESGSNITASHYGTLFAMLATFAIISGGVLLFCIVHLVRRRDVNTPTKMTWILLLVIFLPVSAILFWYFKIRPEPRFQQVKNIK